MESNADGEHDVCVSGRNSVRIAFAWEKAVGSTGSFISNWTSLGVRLVSNICFKFLFGEEVVVGVEVGVVV